MTNTHPHRPGIRRRGLRAVSVPARAFSMIEMIIVIAIIGILAAIAVPRLASASTRYRVECAAARLARDLEKARQQAITRSFSFDVEFDQTQRSYTTGPAGIPSEAQSVDLAADPYGVSIQVISPASDRFTFDGFGNASTDAHIVLSAGEWTSAVRVRAQGGSVQWSLE